QALRQSAFEIVGEADCAQQAIDLCVRERPELSLLDLELPGGGLWAAREISTRVPDSAVLMLSACASDGSLLGALRAGAVGYLMMDLDPARLPNALQSVIDGQAVVPRRLVAGPADAGGAEGRRYHA